MLRRSFLSLLPAAPALTQAEVSILPPAPMLTVELLLHLPDRQVAQLKLPTGTWDVMWTGWKDHMWNLERIGQWVARIHGDSRPFAHWQVYVSTPGGWGALDLGEAVDSSPRFPQVHPMWWDDSGIEDNQKLEAARAFVELITVHDWKIATLTPLSKSAANDLAFSRVSTRTQFYLDACRPPLCENSWGFSKAMIEKAREFGFRIDY